MKDRITNLRVYSLMTLFSMSGASLAEPAPVAVWVAQYNGPISSSDSPARSITDTQGNTYVTGRSCTGRNETTGGCSDDYATLKYDSNGQRLWVARFDIGGHDSPTDMSVDTQGNVYVTGISKKAGTSDSDFTTVKYDRNGVQLWVRHLNVGQSDRADSVSVDNAGNVIVTGNANGITTVKYSSTGAQLWVARFIGQGPRTTAIVQGGTDAAGNVYVTGDSGGNYLSLKYDPNGNQLWSATYDGGAIDGPSAMAVDEQGNLLVTGISYLANFSSGWFTTVKYDTYGNELWVDQSVESQSPPADMVSDLDGNIYITGQSVTPSIPASQITYKLNADGAQVWLASYGTGHFVAPRSIAIDTTGNVFVSGQQQNPTSNIHEVVTVKYDRSGIQQWTLGSGDSSQRGGLVSLDEQGNIYVTKSGKTPATWTDFVTIKYVPAGQPAPQADLQMTIMPHHGDFIAVGESLSYVLIINNHGPHQATSLESALRFPAGTTITNHWSLANCTATERTLNCSFEMLAAGATAWVIVTATPSAPGNVEAVTSITANTPDPNPANNSNAVSTRIIAAGPYADIAVGLSDSPDPARVGTTVVYLASVQNLGPDTDSNVNARMFVNGTIITGTWSSQGSCSESGGLVRCTLGPLASNATVWVAVYALALGGYNGSQNVSLEATGTNDPVPGNNRALAETAVLY